MTPVNPVPHQTGQRPAPAGLFRAPKIQPWHLDRLAVVYVRQSTAQQVAENKESTDRQYGLVNRAIELGWPPDRILVFDDDQVETWVFLIIVDRRIAVGILELFGESNIVETAATGRRADRSISVEWFVNRSADENTHGRRFLG